MIRQTLISLFAVLAFLSLAGSSRTSQKTDGAQQNANHDDPCSGKEYSNAELRECYTREQEKATTQVNELAREIASDFRKNGPELGPIVAGELRKAAHAVEAAQSNWVSYRKHHCDAIAFSYTTGSGAGTAYEECMYKLAQHRMAELKADFSH